MRSVSVFTPTPGGGTSADLTFTINNPLPGLTSLTPSSTPVGGLGFTLTVSGAGFVPTSVIKWNGASLATTYLSSTQLSASVDAAKIAALGAASVIVFNPTPAGGESSSQIFTITHSLPQVTSLDPYEAIPGSPAFVLTVVGSNFASGAVIRWDGVDLVTQWVSSTQLTTTLSDSLIAAFANVNVTVFNPLPNGGESGALPFHIGRPTPLLSWLDPSMVTAGDGGLVLTVHGSHFASDSTIRWNGVDLDTIFVDEGELTAVIDAADIAAMGTVTITVATPDPGGVESTPRQLLIMGEARVFLPQVRR